MKYSYWVSYQFNVARGSGFGACCLDFSGPITPLDMQKVRDLIADTLPGGAGIVVLAISKFES